MARSYTQKMASLWVPSPKQQEELSRPATADEVAMLNRKLISKYLPFITLKLTVAQGHNTQRVVADGAILTLGDLGSGIGNVIAYFPKSKEMYHFYLKEGDIRHASKYTAKWLIEQHEEHIKRRNK